MSETGASVRFSDGKEPGALRTIGEVASALGIKQHVLRYWEQQFPMLRPLKRSGGRRYYRPEDIALVERIDSLVNTEGYTLRGARQAIEAGEGAADESPVSDDGAGDPASPMAADVLPQLLAIRARLARALEA